VNDNLSEKSKNGSNKSKNSPSATPLKQTVPVNNVIASSFATAGSKSVSNNSSTNVGMLSKTKLQTSLKSKGRSSDKSKADKGKLAIANIIDRAKAYEAER
jgi:hypothetical protein